MKKRKKLGDGRGRVVLPGLDPRAMRFPTIFLRAVCMVCWLLAFAGVGAWTFWSRDLAAKQKKIPRNVSGLVLDKDDNPIVGATVVLTDLQTSKETEMYSQEGGRYEFSDLHPTHDYKVQATYKGLSSEARKVSSFDTRNSIVLNLKISPPSS